MVLSTAAINTTTFARYLAVSLTNSILTKADLVYIRDQIQFYGEGLTNDSSSGDPVPAAAAVESIEIPKPPVTFDSTVSAPIAELHKSLFIYIFQMLLKQGLFFQTKRHDPPKRFRQPEQLLELMDFNLGTESTAHTDLLKQVEKMIQYSGHQSHPFFVYQLWAGVNPYGLIADYISIPLKPSMISYESNPVFTLIEHELLKKIRQLIGYPEGEEGGGDGLINPGGSFSNIMAIALARYHKFPQTKLEGISSITIPPATAKLVVYVNIDCHYSFNKGGFLLGIGMENVVMIRTNEKGQMSIEGLLEAINGTLSDGNIPFMVGATAGTTVLGAIDPLEEIAEICKEHGMWFHVDGVFGGGLIFSEKYKSEKLKGIELSDSVALNAHKMLSVTPTISVLVTRHKGIMKSAFGFGEGNGTTTGDGRVNSNSNNDDRSRLYDRHQFDTGENHVLGNQEAMAFKFWMLWKAQGTTGLGKHIEYGMDNAKYAMELLKERQETFEPILTEFELTNVCFLYIPKRFRPMNRTSESFKIEMDPIAPVLQSTLARNGIMEIVSQKASSTPNIPTFLKLVLMSSSTTKPDIKYLLDQIDFFGQDL